MKVIYKMYWDFPFGESELQDGKKMIGNQRVSGLSIFEVTENNIKLMVKHNSILSQIEQLQRKLSDITNKMEKPIKR